MNEKKEVQVKILKEKANGKATKEELLNILRHVSPGTNLRSALNGVLKSGKGVLIVVSNDQTQQIIDGGFKLNCRFTPQRLAELAKMDGAIILSNDMKRIIYSNVLLTPDHKIASKETGTRHKAAERTAKMTGTLVIAISERKKELNIYYKNIKHHLKETSDILRRMTETLQVLEKQRELFDKYVDQLNHSELKDDLEINLACKSIQKGKAIQKILEEKEKDIIELGKEGIEMKLRMKELIKGVEKETNLIIKDYTKLNQKKSKKLVDCLTYEELIDSENILTSLAQTKTNQINSVKGWRLLSKTSLADTEIALLIKDHKALNNIINLNKESYEELIGEERTQLLIKELIHIKGLKS